MNTNETIFPPKEIEMGMRNKAYQWNGLQNQIW